MKKLDRIAVGTMTELRKIGTPEPLCKAMISVFESLADVTERLDRIEKSDAARASTRSFMLDAPTNGAMQRGLSGMSLAEVTAKFALIPDGLHVADKH